MTTDAHRWIGVVAAATAVWLSPARTAAAGTGSTPVTLQYTCTYFGIHTMSAAVEWGVPSSWPVGEPAPALPITVSATVDPSVAADLRLVGVTSFQGTADASSDLVAPQGDIPQTVSLNVPRTQLPHSGPMVVPASGTTPVLTFSKPGLAKTTVGAVAMHLTGYDSGGSARIGIDAPCSLDPGQNNVLASFEITAAPSPSPAPSPTTQSPNPTTQPPTTAHTTAPTTPAATGPVTSSPRPTNQSASSSAAATSTIPTTAAPASTDSTSSDTQPSSAASTPAAQVSTAEQLAATKTRAGMNAAAWSLLVLGILGAGAACIGGAMWLKRRNNG
jgi:hypothetical protein